MSQIKVQITKGSNEVSSIVTDITSNTLPDLIASLKTAKTETNAILTKIVDQQKSSQTKNTRVEACEDDDEDSEEENDEENSSKKQKI